MPTSVPSCPRRVAPGHYFLLLFAHCQPGEVLESCFLVARLTQDASSEITPF
jgi:hypothetical protein